MLTSRAWWFLFILVAGVLAPRARTWVLALAILLAGAETARIHPHYLAFFNLPSGGPGRGPHYLLDSNID